MANRATALRSRVDGELRGVDMVVDNCPRHRVIHFLMKCPRCSRLFWEHCERVAKLPRIVRP